MNIIERYIENKPILHIEKFNYKSGYTYFLREIPGTDLKVTALGHEIEIRTMQNMFWLYDYVPLPEGCLITVTYYGRKKGDDTNGRYCNRSFTR